MVLMKSCLMKMKLKELTKLLKMGKVKKSRKKNGAGKSSPNSEKTIILQAYTDSITNQLSKGRVPKTLFERLVTLSKNKILK